MQIQMQSSLQTLYNQNLQSHLVFYFQQGQFQEQKQGQVCDLGWMLPEHLLKNIKITTTILKEEKEAQILYRTTPHLSFDWLINSHSAIWKEAKYPKESIQEKE